MHSDWKLKLLLLSLDVDMYVAAWAGACRKLDSALELVLPTLDELLDESTRSYSFRFFLAAAVACADVTKPVAGFADAELGSVSKPGVANLLLLSSLHVSMDKGVNVLDGLDEKGIGDDDSVGEIESGGEDPSSILSSSSCATSLYATAILISR